MFGGKVEAKAVPLPDAFVSSALLVEFDCLPAVVRGIGVGPGKVVTGAIEPSVIEGGEGRGHVVQLEGDGGGSRYRDRPGICERSNSEQGKENCLEVVLTHGRTSRGCRAR